MDTPKSQVKEVLWACEFFGMGGHFRERWVSATGDRHFEFWLRHDSGSVLEMRISREQLEQRGLYEQFLVHSASSPVSEDYSHSVLTDRERTPKTGKVAFWDLVAGQG
jgi:hypothetical protein